MTIAHPQPAVLVCAADVVREGGPAVDSPVTDAGGEVCFADLHINTATRELTREGTEVALTPIEFDLLATLLSNPRRVWDREALLQSVWGCDWLGDGHLIEVHVGNLRRKLGDRPGVGRYIRTVRGVGYRLGAGHPAPSVHHGRMSSADRSILEHIAELVSEEKTLRLAHVGQTPSDADRARLEQLEGQLDQAWDLLRQRRAREEFHEDPDQTEPRSVQDVTRYLQ